MANLFGTLNRFIGRLDSSNDVPRQTSASKSYGFQVLRNSNTDLLLEPWFDFIIGINKHPIDNGDPNLFTTEIRNCAGSTISLEVYSAKGHQIRELYASVPPDASGLGLSLQWASLGVSEDVWHILDVMPNSPADTAGLLPYSDYVIGSPDGQLQGEGALGDLVETSMDTPLRLYVYNHEYDVTRMLTITPTKSWGGEGALGCILGYGALHRVPAPLTEPSQAPGETLFESNENFTQPLSEAPLSGGPGMTQNGAQDFLVPANMDYASTSPPPPTSSGPPPPSGKGKKQRAHQPAPAAGLDDYFAEGEQKSREVEGGGSTPKPSSALPPPPKGPPKAASPGPAAES